MGKVIDIVFAKDNNPNEGHPPLYVICDYPEYCGPVFDTLNKTYIPIAPIDAMCKFKCGCKRTYLPLTLAYGKTIHTFQGQNVGPVNKGQRPNALQKIIVDPGTRAFEGISPGLFYTLLSRVTTLGTLGEKFSSAIYFIWKNMTID